MKTSRNRVPDWVAFLIGAFVMALNIKRIIEEIRQSKSVQDGLIVQNRELRAALEAAQAKLAEAEVDGKEVEEAIALLDAMESEGNAALTENTENDTDTDTDTDGEFTPSGN